MRLPWRCPEVRYCRECGSVMRRVAEPMGFDTRTGEPRFYTRWRCSDPHHIDPRQEGY